MIGGTGLHVVLGSAPPADAPEADIRRYITALGAAGLHVLFCVPGTKVPAELRPSATITKADREYRAEQAAAGRPGADRMRAPSGLHLATDNKTILGRYLKRYREPVDKGGFGEDSAVNLAVEVGRSRLIVVDCDTRDEVRAFLADTLGDPDAGLAPTVRSPGQRDAVTGEWAHKDGGHYWFTVPAGVELPRSSGQLKRSVVLDAGTPDERTASYSLLWADRYVLIPPSVRAEGAYTVAGEAYDAAGTDLVRWIVEHEAQREAARIAAEQRRLDRGGADDEFDDAIAQWAEATSWTDLLEPLEWTPYSIDSSCGCGTWTRPGPHGSDKSATAHDSGCSLGRYTVTNAPLHIWSDNPGEPFDAWIGAPGGSKTITKLRVAALSRYGGDMSAAMRGLGITTGDPDHSDARAESLGLDLGPMSDLSSGIDITTPENREKAAELLVGVARNAPVDPAPAAEPQPEPAAVAPQVSAPAEDADESEDDEPESSDDPTVIEKSDGFPLTIRPFDLWRGTPPPEWDIEGLIERGSLCSVIGDPGVGKSMVVLDMLAHMVSGRSWQHRRTLRQRVLYLPGEGLVGAVARLRAWESAYGSDIGAELWISDTILQARSSADHWSILAEFIVRNRISVLVFDTFARMSVGIDENSATEVGLVINRLDQVRRETDATVIVVHHTGKSSGRSRGSSALTGAVDSELITVEGWNDDVQTSDGLIPEGKQITLAPLKVKNGPDGRDAEVALLLKTHGESAIITDPSGDPHAGLFDPASTIPVVMPEHIGDTALRIYAHLLRSATQLGATVTDLARDVSPDEFTAKRRAGSARYWRGRIAEAIDLAAAVGGLVNATSSARWAAAPGKDVAELRSALFAESKRRNGLADDVVAAMVPHEPTAADRASGATTEDSRAAS